MKHLCNWASLALALFSITISSCGPERREVDDITLARQLLNERNFEDAIGLLEGLHRTDPGDTETRLLLSSALAGSVGLNAVDAFDALKDKLFDKPLAETSGNVSASQSLLLTKQQSSETEPGNDDPKADAIAVFEREFLKFSIALRDAGTIVANLPYIEGIDRRRLVRGLTLLREVGKGNNDYVVAQLYSGILSIVQFVNFIRDAVPYGEKNLDTWYFALYCYVDISAFANNLGSASYYLAYAFDSLNNARRSSDNPVFDHLGLASEKLRLLNNLKNEYSDALNLTSLAHQLSTYAYCH
jgi:hypothetical protein